MPEIFYQSEIQSTYIRYISKQVYKTHIMSTRKPFNSLTNKTINATSSTTTIQKTDENLIQNKKNIVVKSNKNSENKFQIYFNCL
jgi:hypothetical protein